MYFYILLIRFTAQSIINWIVEMYFTLLHNVTLIFSKRVRFRYPTCYPVLSLSFSLQFACQFLNKHTHRSLDTWDLQPDFA